MSARSPERLVPRNDLARLQRALLRAVLLGEPLPGGGPARLADLGFILRHPRIYVLDEHLAGPITLEGAPKPVSIVSKSDVQRLAREEGDIAYLCFLPLEADEDGAIWLTIEGRLETRDRRGHPLGLSRLQVKLRKVEGRWEITDETRGLAG